MNCLLFEGMPTLSEMEAADISAAADLRSFLRSHGAGSFPGLGAPPLVSEEAALERARSLAIGPDMAGHSEFVEAVETAPGVWAIVGSEGQIVGSVEDERSALDCYRPSSCRSHNDQSRVEPLIPGTAPAIGTYRSPYLRGDAGFVRPALDGLMPVRRPTATSNVRVFLDF